MIFITSLKANGQEIRSMGSLSCIVVYKITNVEAFTKTLTKLRLRYA